MHLFPHVFLGLGADKNPEREWAFAQTCSEEVLDESVTHHGLGPFDVRYCSSFA